MNQKVTVGIVLKRTNYGEADRIVTVLTPEQGKLRLMVKGARKLKSKLAGGIELFSISDLTYLPGKGEMGTLVSSRMRKHYASIVKDLDRTQQGYELIKLLDKFTEDEPEADYFHLLEQTFAALDDATIDLNLLRCWFLAQLLRLAGHTPNLTSTAEGQPLAVTGRYDVDYENMLLTPHGSGKLRAEHIKMLRLLFSEQPIAGLRRISGLENLLPQLSRTVESMAKTYIM